MAIVWQVYPLFTVKISLKHFETIWQWRSGLKSNLCGYPTRGFPVHPTSSHALRLHQLCGDRSVEFPAL